jgi:hypothetical protein
MFQSFKISLPCQESKKKSFQTFSGDTVAEECKVPFTCSMNNKCTCLSSFEGSGATVRIISIPAVWMEGVEEADFGK